MLAMLLGRGRYGATPNATKLRYVTKYCSAANKVARCSCGLSGNHWTRLLPES
jgi:hypothetical protein